MPRKFGPCAHGEEGYCEVCESNLLAALSARDQRIAELEFKLSDALSSVYVAGMWKCPKCNYVLHKNIICAESGQVGINISLVNEQCPNDGEPMQRCKWRDEAMENVEFIAQARQRIATLEAALAAALAEEWQPIESAPKDGTEILVVMDGRVWLCSYIPERVVDNDDEFMPKGTVYSAGWYLGCDGFLPSGDEGMTHWRPLPPPPAQEGGGV